MPRSYVIFFKTVGRKWFIFLIIAILIVFTFNQEVAIWMTVISIIIFILSYLPHFFFTSKLVRVMKEYFMIEDDTIAKELDKPLRKIQEKMFDISQNQGKKKWIIIFLNKHYIYFHENTIDKFLELYKKGYNEKEILERLKKNDLRTRLEVKAIRETLLKNNRLVGRDKTVKQRQQEKLFKS